MPMIRDDLLKDSCETSGKLKPVSFTAPDSNGNLWTRKGNEIGTIGQWPVYRNRSDDLFAIPPDLIDAE